MSLISGIRENLNQLQTAVTVAIEGVNNKFSFQSINNSMTLSSWNQILIVDASSSNITLTLPVQSDILGSVIQVLKIDDTANTITIVPSNGNINGISNFVLNNQYDSLVITFNQDNSLIFSANSVTEDGGTF